MISRLPPWVWGGAWAMAFIAGIVNVVGILGLDHQALTHLTGNTTLLSAALADADLSRAAHFASVLAAFLGGAVLSGMIVQGDSLVLGRHYGVALALESAMLFGAVIVLSRSATLATLMAAFACGLQNAMASTYSGAVVRTTHVSGMFTDLGIGIGHLLRGAPADRKRIALCALIIFGFFAGGLAGAFLFDAIAERALLVPAVLTAAVAIGYVAYASWMRRR